MSSVKLIQGHPVRDSYTCPTRASTLEQGEEASLDYGFCPESGVTPLTSVRGSDL
jgi:hypothetical protein